MKRKITATILMVLLICVFFCLASCKKDDKQVSYVDADLFWKTSECSSVIYSVQADKLTQQELETIVSLQGIVAQTSPSIYINCDKDTAFWLKDGRAKYGWQVVDITDIWQLIDSFRSYLANGKYVLYDSTADKGVSYINQSINYATVVAGAEKYLMVSQSLQALAEQKGLTLGKDVRNSSTKEIFDEYKDSLTTKYLIHQNPTKWQLRDYAIAGKAMCFYSDFYDGSSEVKNEIVEWADVNCPVLGWTENEVNFVAFNSINSKFTVAADWSTNLSLFASLKSQSNKPKNYVERQLTAEKGKHYLAIVMSDGDNLQWMQNGFATDAKYFGSQYRGNYPVTWTISPSMYNLAPQVMDYLYANGSERDQFICGPSGVGYVNVADYNADSLASYAQISASYLKQTGMEYINFLDGTANKNSLGEFAKYDSVKGGVWSVGNKYIEGDGAVYWINDKPFVTMRETLWREIGNDEDNKYYGFTERVAQRINSYKTDPTRIEGYTVLVAHAWSIGSMDYINRFVQNLDEHVELVTVGELLDLVDKNVPHTDVDYLNDIQPSDIKELCDISSEQFIPSQLESLETDSTRIFTLAEDQRSKYKWTFGNGGLQYDSAKYVNEGILLDGSDLGDVVDPMPNSWAVNKFDLTKADKYLIVYAKGSVDCDVNYRVRVLQVVDGKIVATVLNSESYEKPLDEYGWYKIDNDSPSFFVYDLTAFADKTVAISIEQDDTGDGNGETITIYRMEISFTIQTLDNITNWTAADIYTFWTQKGKVVRHKEGVCLEDANAMISCKVNVASQKMQIAMRMFDRPSTEEQDVPTCVVVKVNGKVVRVSYGITDYVKVTNTQENFFYLYDMSDYVGQTVTLEISVVVVDCTEGDHCCISNIKI